MTGAPTPTAHWRRHGDVAVIELDHAPVNALAYTLRTALVQGLDRAAEDPAIRAIVLIGAHGVFCGGADLRQLDSPLYWQYPRTIELAARIDAIAKPVVAAIGGLAMGGGLELALACHYRIARQDSRLALPEIRLGLMPGGGGTLRLPRLIGPERALQMMLTGDTVDGRRAADWGLVDGLATDDLLDEAVRFARLQAQRCDDRTGTPRRAIDMPVDATRARAALKHARRQLALGPDRGAGPGTLIDCIEAGLFEPLERAVDITARATAQRMASAEASGHRYQFFAQREAARVEPFDPARAIGVTDVNLLAAAGSGLLTPLHERLGKTAYRSRWLDPDRPEPSRDGNHAAPSTNEIIVVDLGRPEQQALTRLSRLDQLWPHRVPFVLALADGAFGAAGLPVHPQRPIAGLRLPRSATARVTEVVALRTGTEPLRGALARLVRQLGWQPIQSQDGPQALTDTLAAIIEDACAGGSPPVRDGTHWPAGLLAALRAAGRRLLAGGQLQRLSDIDVALVSDFDFPAHQGGPFHLEARAVK